MTARDAVADRVLTWLHDQKPAMLALLHDLVDAESPSREPETQWAVHAVLKDALEARGFAVRTVRSERSGPHLFARGEERRPGPRQLLLGHYDTVWPVGTLAGRPFTEADGVVRGPGTFDMKAGLTHCVFALEALHALGLECPVAPVVFVNADEEIGSRDSGRWIRRLAPMVDRALVLEPALGPAGALKTTRKGIGRFTITVHGKAAHAGLDPTGGASAILELSHVIQTLFALNDLDRGVTVNVGTIDGGLQPNVIAPTSQAVVDVRVRDNEDGERVTAAILAIEPTTPGISLEITGGIGRPAMESTARNRALWTLACAQGDRLGLELEEAAVGGGSDGNTTSQYTATLDGLGAVGDGAHAEHEHVIVDRSLERAALLTLVLASPPLAEG